jgi:DNA-binding response OmpR family regulator
MDTQSADLINNNRPLIVVVEGSPDEMCLISDSLQNSAYRVLGYIDPEKAYHRIMEDLPALTIIDVHLLSDGGNKLIRQIREEERLEAMPVIAVVAGEVEKDSAGGGADVFLSRPFDAELLLKTVESLLRGKTL